MSWQANLANRLLKTLIKAPLTIAPISTRTMPIFRRIVDAGSRHISIPAFVSIEHTTLNGVPAEWVTGGDNVSHSKVILYCHGGGYFAGSPRSHRSLTWRLSRDAGMRVLAIDYRLFPEHSLSDAMTDAFNAYKGLLADGYHPNDIVIGGDSAGGHLALVTSQEIRNRGIPMPAALVCLSPFGDLSETSESLITNAKSDAYLPAQVVRAIQRILARNSPLPPLSPMMSPVYGDYTNFPPLFLQVSTSEVIADDSRRIANTAAAAGVSVALHEWDNMPHVFSLLGGLLPEANAAIREIATFIRQHVALNGHRAVPPREHPPVATAN